MAVSITSPPPPPPPPAPLTAVDANTNPFPVSGTDTDINSVDGTLTDETSSNIYHPVSGGTVSQTGKWTLNFNTGNSIDKKDLLHVHVYDTTTLSPASVDYIQGSFFKGDIEPAKSKGSPSATVKIPDSINTEEVSDIPVVVTTPKDTKGFILLTLRKNNPGGTPPKIVLSCRLFPSGTTSYTFPAIDMSYWDIIFVTVIIIGGESIGPIILKQRTSQPQS